MGHSGIVDWLFRYVPLRPVRAVLARHAERCPACAARLAGRDEVRRVLVAAADLGRLDDIWPSVRRGAEAGGGEAGGEEKPTVTRSPRAWRYAAAFAGLAAAAFLTVSVVSYLGPASGGAGWSAESGGGFELHYAKVQHKTADTYVIQSPEDPLVLVWVEKSL